MASLSFVCAYCAKPLLDAEHAKKHVLTACPDSPGTKLYTAAKAMLEEFAQLSERGQICVPSLGAVDALEAAVAQIEGRS